MTSQNKLYVVKAYDNDEFYGYLAHVDDDGATCEFTDNKDEALRFLIDPALIAAEHVAYNYPYDTIIEEE